MWVVTSINENQESFNSSKLTGRVVGSKKSCVQQWTEKQILFPLNFSYSGVNLARSWSAIVIRQQACVSIPIFVRATRKTERMWRRRELEFMAQRQQRTYSTTAVSGLTGFADWSVFVVRFHLGFRPVWEMSESLFLSLCCRNWGRTVLCVNENKSNWDYLLFAQAWNKFLLGKWARYKESVVEEIPTSCYCVSNRKREQESQSIPGYKKRNRVNISSVK